jgi:hypothetical protein
MANQFKAKHNTKFVTFSNGESVFLLNYRFGKTHWLPVKMIEQVKNSPTFRIEVPSLGRAVHHNANQLRRRLDDVSSPPAEVHAVLLLLRRLRHKRISIVVHVLSAKLSRFVV